MGANKETDRDGSKRSKIRNQQKKRLTGKIRKRG